MDTDPHLNPFVDFHADPAFGSYRYLKKLSTMDGMPALLFISEEEDEGVIRAFRDLQSDIERVTGSRPSRPTRRRKRIGSLLQVPSEKTR